MGACYDVTFTLRICNHNAAVDVMKKYILNAPNVDFSLEDYKKDGVGLESLSDLMRIILAGRKSSNFCEKVTTAGTLIYTNCFEASYGWERVMIDIFYDLAPYLYNYSTLYIGIDNDYDSFLVDWHEVKQTH